MTITRYIAAFACVIGIAAGQILFKTSAQAMKEGAAILSTNALLPLISAFALYGITSLAWVWVLREMPLNHAYPFMAGAFIIVPIASYLIFGDRLNLTYLLGSLITVVGIVITISASGENS